MTEQQATGMTTLANQREQHAAALARDLDDLGRQLADMPEVERVILFGSYAAGRRDLLTDLDLLVVRVPAGFRRLTGRVGRPGPRWRGPGPVSLYAARDRTAARSALHP